MGRILRNVRFSRRIRWKKGADFLWKSALVADCLLNPREDGRWRHHLDRHAESASASRGIRGLPGRTVATSCMPAVCNPLAHVPSASRKPSGQVATGSESPGARHLQAISRSDTPFQPGATSVYLRWFVDHSPWRRARHVAILAPFQLVNLFLCPCANRLHAVSPCATDRLFGVYAGSVSLSHLQRVPQCRRLPE